MHILHSLESSFEFFAFKVFDAEDVVTRYDILRAQGLPVVVAVLHVVEQTDLFQVVTALQGSVADDHLQVCGSIL